MPLVLALLVFLAPATDIVAVDDVLSAPRALLGRTRSGVERALGAPASVRARMLTPAPGAAAEPVDELVYAGVVVAVSHRTGSVRRVQISEPRFALPRGLNVGAERARVERVLGEPQLVSDASALYVDADGFPNTVEFYFRDGRVSRIEWTFAPAD
ncbi:MAG TPA: hypothetical protein VFL90_14040 [Methylomirabilota bacterium]|nr:hypothetical protein [Methylomirabilota bacterium]